MLARGREVWAEHAGSLGDWPTPGTGSGTGSGSAYFLGMKNFLRSSLTILEGSSTPSSSSANELIIHQKHALRRSSSVMRPLQAACLCMPVYAARQLSRSQHLRKVWSSQAAKYSARTFYCAHHDCCVLNATQRSRRIQLCQVVGNRML